ncbi:unnamed protein product, partial [Ilex paraguariensis]
EATWENTQLLLDQFSDVDLEDKSPLRWGSVDEPIRLAMLPKPIPNIRDDDGREKTVGGN